MVDFEYSVAFSRNIGWLTPAEQQVLRHKRIAIAGLGGVGGSHLLTLTRLGIGAFSIADPDAFELANLNRQAGATLSTLGEGKALTLERLALDINPELDIRRFDCRIEGANIDDFLQDVDLYVDGLDFFSVPARREVFAACAARGIPAITAAPLGMGAALLNFLPGKMTFEDYFRMDGRSEREQLLRFIMGLSPSMLQAGYLVDESTVNLDAHKGPSTPMACELCAGLAATHALKILLNRGRVRAAPRGLHFDAYRNRTRKTWRPGGNGNPVQKLGLAVLRKRLARTGRNRQQRPAHTPATPIERILELARWAPSGDNTQPWRFEIVDDTHFVVHAHDTRDWCVYDLQGHASQIAVGALLETIKIAATGEGMSATCRRRVQSPETHPVIDVLLATDPGCQASRLIPLVKERATQRRPMSPASIPKATKRALEQAVGPAYQVTWFESGAEKWEMARLLYLNAGIRLKIREAYEVHRRVIEWDAFTSEDRIPDHSVGLDPLTRRLMKWAMGSWRRVDTLNRYLAGTHLPRVQLDLLPAVLCGAHFVIVSREPLSGIDAYLAGGEVVQRFWLTATQLGLQCQPEMTPLIFSSYARQSLPFTESEDARATAAKLCMRLEGAVGKDEVHRSLFMGRVGFSTPPTSRSLRLPWRQLLV